MVCALTLLTVFFPGQRLLCAMHFHFFLLLSPVLSQFFSVSLLVSMPRSVFPVFPPVVSESHVLHEGLWSILNRFFCSMREVDATSFSYIEISGFLTRVCWRALVPWVFWHLWKFSDFGCMGLLVCPLLCSFGLHVRPFAEPFRFCCCDSVVCDFRWGFDALSIVLSA